MKYLHNLNSVQHKPVLSRYRKLQFWCWSLQLGCWMTSNKTATLIYKWVFLITVITAVTANAQVWWHLHPLRNSLHEREATSYLSCKILYSDLNFLELNVEWIVLVVFNPAREFHFQTLHLTKSFTYPAKTVHHGPYHTHKQLIYT
jgi:hypothetical protein